MYLISQLWWYLTLAFLLGALIGYLLWRMCNRPLLESRFERSRHEMASRLKALEAEAGRTLGAAAPSDNEAAKLRSELQALRLEAEKAKAAAADLAKKHAEDLKKVHEDAIAEAAKKQADELKKMKGEVAAALAAAGEVKQLAGLKAEAAKVEGGAAAAPAARPASFLSAPRGGKADDLKLIWGVGDKLEKVLNGAGIYHFDQIAGWSDKDLAWFDKTFSEAGAKAKSDKWVEQCRKLATGWRPQNASGERPKDL